jgi:D-alanine-D-alanine ligase
MKIAILYSEQTDASSKDEQDVLVQFNAVSSATRSIGHTPLGLAVNMNLTDVAKNLGAAKPDLVFNLVESLAGHDRLLHIIPSLLDILNIPYTGAKTDALFMTSNKILAKQTLKAAGIATPDWLTLEEYESSRMLPDACIIKSVWDHASKGLNEHSVVPGMDMRHLFNELTARKKKFGGDWFAETFIAGREFNLSILAGKEEPEILPAAEIRFGENMPGKINIVGYRAKWEENSLEYASTNRHFDFSPNDKRLLNKLKDIAQDCWRLFSLRGYARVDFRVDQTGTPWVLEVNANPCLSPDAGFAAAVEQAGISFEQAIEKIIADALRE